MDKFTPGPWFHDNSGGIWRRNPSDLYQNGGTVAGDKALATAHKGWYHEGAECYPVEANARLIAAAPDLLEALRLVVDTAENGGWLSAALVIAKAAIAKASGES